jgi:seryl-tRNA synthetase
MLSKKEIDTFILKEASKYLFEEEEYSLDDSIENTKERIKQIETKLKTYTEKLKADRQIQTATQDAERKKLADQQVKVTQDDLNLEKENLEAAKNELKTLEDRQKQALTQQSNAEAETVQMGISEAVIKSPLRQVAPKPLKVKKPKPKKKEVIIRFDTNTPSPFTVKFSSRGFVVGNTRLSFELLEKAISKQFSITLKSGLILTPVKMQKILKYKNRY